MAKEKLPPVPLEQLAAAQKHIQEAIEHESPLAFVLLGASAIERHLQTLLAAHFIKGDTSLALLDPIAGALGEVKVRADLAYCLGLIPPFVHKLCLKVGEIRNKMAHSHVPLQFDGEILGPLIEGLKMPEYFSFSSRDGDTKSMAIICDKRATLRERFQLAVFTATGVIALLTEHHVIKRTAMAES